MYGRGGGEYFAASASGPTVVLDNGGCTLKAGFAGKAEPVGCVLRRLQPVLLAGDASARDERRYALGVMGGVAVRPSDALLQRNRAE